MPSWKDNYRLYDMDENQPIDLQCKRCGTMRKYRRDSAIEAMQRQGLSYHDARQLYPSEFEQRVKCRVFRCRGAMRLEMPMQHKISAWIGGMA